MKIDCRHGYFVFEETRSGELSDFVSLFGIPIVRREDHFTFEDLAEAPDYSIKGSLYLNAIATETYAGRPWEVMRANGLVYNFDSGLLVQALTVTQIIALDASTNIFFSPGLIIPGSLTKESARVTDYAAWFSKDTMRFKYSEVGYV